MVSIESLINHHALLSLGVEGRMDEFVFVAVEKVNCWKEEFVIKYTLDSIKLKNVNDIVDKRVRDAVRARYAECGDSESEYKKSLAERPLTLDGTSRTP